MEEVALYGKDIRRLTAHLDLLNPAVEDVDADGLQSKRSRLENRAYHIRSCEYRFDETARERRRLESEIRGLERLLVALAADRDSGPDDARIQRRSADLVAQLNDVDKELGDLSDRIRKLRADLRGDQAALVEHLATCIGAASERRLSRQVEDWLAEVQRLDAREVLGAPMWSPTQVVGYRVWQMHDRGMRGAWTTWSRPEYTAKCPKGGGVPHAGRRCSMVGSGCGVYATKSLDSLFTEYSIGKTTRCAIGVVGLSGKVVEHTHGYRAERAAVIALVTSEGGVVRVIDEPADLVEVFARPALHVVRGRVLAADVTSSTQWRQVIRQELTQRIPTGEEP